MAVSHDLNLKYFEELATTISQGLDIAIPAIEICFVVPATSPEVTVRSVKSAGRLSSWRVGCCRSKTCWTKGREEEEVRVVIFKSTNTKWSSFLCETSARWKRFLFVNVLSIGHNTTCQYHLRFACFRPQYQFYHQRAVLQHVLRETHSSWNWRPDSDYKTSQNDGERRKTSFAGIEGCECTPICAEILSVSWLPATCNASFRYEVITRSNNHVQPRRYGELA